MVEDQVMTVCHRLLLQLSFSELRHLGKCFSRHCHSLCHAYTTRRWFLLDAQYEWYLYSCWNDLIFISTSSSYWGDFSSFIAPLGEGEGVMTWYTNAPCSVHIVQSQVSQKTHMCGMVIVMRWYDLTKQLQKSTRCTDKLICVDWVTLRRDWVPPPS